jgi:hypothetical protein
MGPPQGLDQDPDLRRDRRCISYGWARKEA